jgi:hypothetical protein
MNRKILEFVASFPIGYLDESWVLATQIVDALRVSKEEIHSALKESHEDGLVRYATTNEPGGAGLLSVGITMRGRLWLKSEPYDHLPNPRRKKPYNLL